MGICGFIGNDDRILLGHMCNAIERTGDFASLFLDSQVGLGVSSPQNRIVCNEDRSLWIAYDGELYNNSALRDSLENKGHDFCTSSEAETILRLYEDYGRNCCKQLIGSFVFAIRDSNRNKLLLARDRFGDRLLYYTRTNDYFLFSSKIKGLFAYEGTLRELDLQAVNDFLAYFFVPAPKTLFKGISKMLPAHTLELEGREFSLLNYWDLDFSNINTHLNIDNWCDLVAGKLRDSVRTRLERNGSSLGISLSGGLDSTVVLALMRKLTDEPIKSFSVGYENWEFDELKFARMVSETYETDHYEQTIDTEDVRQALPKIVEASEQPVGGYVSIPTYFVYELASKHSRNVFTGDGADLTFWGFPWGVGMDADSPSSNLPKWVKKAVWRFMLAVPRPPATDLGLEVRRLARRYFLSAEFQFYDFMTHFDEEEKRQLYTENMRRKLISDSKSPLQQYYRSKKFNSDIEARYCTLIKTWLPDYWDWDKDLPLSNPISIVTPLHDHQLMELSQTIPAHLKQPKKSVLKYIFRKSAIKYKLAPDFVIKRKKVGIQTIPIVRWLNGGLRDLCQEVLQRSYSGIHEYLDRHYLSKVSKAPVRTIAGAHRVWGLLCFIMWYERFIKDEKAVSL